MPNIKPQNQKYREVRWIDVMGIAEWQTLDVLLRKNFPLFCTRGWILHQDSARLIVAATREMNSEHPDDTTYGDITIIPMSLVQKIVRVNG